MLILTPDNEKIKQLVSILDDLEIIKDVIPLLTPREQSELLLAMEEALEGDGWPIAYINRDRYHIYQPHHELEMSALIRDDPRHLLVKGSEGSGKSVFGIIKDLERIRHKMSGMMASPNLPHFQRSLWKEFQRWCPWDYVVPAHRRMAAKEWMPTKPFDVVFENGAYLHCLGAKNISSLEGPNLSFAHFDEARLFDDSGAIKTIDGRIRIEGPDGEKPQAWYTTTPRMNWLYEFFGPIKCKCPACGGQKVAIQEGEPLVCPVCKESNLVITDKYADFKFNSRVVSLHVTDNADNLSDGFVDARGRTLTENEKAVLIDALWIDDESDERFLPSILLWDACRVNLPTLTGREPMVVGIDASTKHDTFAIVGVTRDPSSPDGRVAVRFVENWEPDGHLLDYKGTDENPGPELRVLWLAENYDVIEVVYDPYQLHDFTQRMVRDHGIWCTEFSQGALRLKADRQLLDLIHERRIVHEGNVLLREHMDNANRRRTEGSGRGLRIVKRTESLPIDCCVSLSMAAYECLRLNL